MLATTIGNIIIDLGKILTIKIENNLIIQTVKRNWSNLEININNHNSNINKKLQSK